MRHTAANRNAILWGLLVYSILLLLTGIGLGSQW